LRSFNSEIGEFKVVKEAWGPAPWGGTIKAELLELEIGNSILVSLPELGNRALAMLNGNLWEIWVTPRNEIHVVRRDFRTENGFPPDEYLFLAEEHAPSVDRSARY